ncbi:MAG: hypothetical protein ACJA14_002633 [Ilumatobacter sp.]|jgi:hypothetical protein
MDPLTEAGVQVDHAESFGWADQFGKVLLQRAVRARRPRSTMKDAGGPRRRSPRSKEVMTSRRSCDSDRRCPHSPAAARRIRPG